MGIMAWEEKGEEERIQCVVCFLCLFLEVNVALWKYVRWNSVGFEISKRAGRAGPALFDEFGSEL